MTQEQALKIFESELGQQLDNFYEVELPNNTHQIFIRLNEAIDFAAQYNLSNDCIKEWFLEQSGKDLFTARTF